MPRSSGVILLAAGSSRRFGNSRPKQFLSLCGEPLFVKSMRAFLELPSVGEMIVVTRRKDMSYVAGWSSRLRHAERVRVVEGGAFRGESVRNGVRALSPQTKVVLIHDAARPLINRDIIQRVERAALKTGAALAAWRLPDTLKASSGTKVKKTIPRKHLWLAQTPQGFRYEIALKCLLHPSHTATDDVELAERRGIPVTLVEGSSINFKVTYPHDLMVCRKLLR